MLQIELLVIGILVAIWIIYWKEERHQAKDRVSTARLQYFWDGEERRKEERINLVFKARYQPIKNPHKVPQYSLTDNISSQGMKLIVYQKLKVGEQLQIEIEIPPHETLKCKGEIAWVKDLAPEEWGREEKEKRSFVIGLRFIELSEPVAERLKYFVNNESYTTVSSAA